MKFCLHADYLGFTSRGRHFKRRSVSLILNIWFHSLCFRCLLFRPNNILHPRSICPYDKLLRDKRIYKKFHARSVSKIGYFTTSSAVLPRQLYRCWSNFIIFSSGKKLVFVQVFLRVLFLFKNCNNFITIDNRTRGSYFRALDRRGLLPDNKTDWRQSYRQLRMINDMPLSQRNGKNVVRGVFIICQF